MNDSDEIFVSDMNNNRIVVFNEYGEFVRSFGHNILSCRDRAGGGAGGALAPPLFWLLMLEH